MATACGWGEQLPTIPWWVQNTVIESQNRRDWKRPLEIPQSNPLFEQVPYGMSYRKVSR